MKLSPEALDHEKKKAERLLYEASRENEHRGDIDQAARLGSTSAALAEAYGMDELLPERDLT